MNNLPFDLSLFEKTRVELIPGVKVPTYGSMTVEELITFGEFQEKAKTQLDQINALCEFTAWIMAKRTGDDRWTPEAVRKMPQEIVNKIVEFFTSGERSVISATSSDEGNAQLTGALSTGDSGSTILANPDLVESNSGIAL
jgi:hypothetical protein